MFNGASVASSGLQNPVTALDANGQPVATYTLFGNQPSLMLAAYEALRDSVYAALVVQTRLKPYLNSIELVIDETGMRLDTRGVSRRPQ